MKLLKAHATIPDSITCGKEYLVTREEEPYYYFIADNGRELHSQKRNVFFTLIDLSGFTDLTNGKGEIRNYYNTTTKEHYYKGKFWSKEEWLKWINEDEIVTND